MMLRSLAVLLALGSTLGCATGGPPKFWRKPDGRIVVTGPMLGPADNLEALAPRLCEKVRDMPGAKAGHQRGGQEYCGAIYRRRGDPRFFASYPSSLGPALDLPGGRKACYPPDEVNDPEASEVEIYADYHSHPAASRFSPEDLQARRQRFYFRVMFNTICEVYLYDFQARTVFQLRDGKFAPIKQVTDDFRGE
ncbi:hypothetical protein DAT35_02355 [Vitiosangium sp. GDMCC 1.1324]|nr:hypothetical protein DAT35_02355 [Vitiosangium sp. GDMCC 1.1324]